MRANGPPRGVLARYTLAVAIVAVATVLRLLLDPLVGDQVPFILSVAAAVVATWFGGIGGGIAATFVSALTTNYLFVPPRWELRVDSADIAGIALFSAVALGLVWFVGRLRRAESTLRKQSDSLRTLSRVVEQSPASVVITDVHGDIEYVNPAFTRVTGYAPEEVIGKNPRMLKSGNTPSEDYRHLWETITAGREWRGEFHNRRKSGELYWEYASISAISDEHGIIHFLAVKEDITERKRAEAALHETAARLAEADRMKDQFIATVSHELRTPLNAMLGWAEMLRTKRLPPAGQQRALEAIASNARRQAQLIDDLLDVSRIIAGSVRLEPTPVDPDAVVRAAVESVMPAAAAKEITLDVALDPAATVIVADASRLQQVVWNLLSNAVKFTPEGGRVSVALRQRDGYLDIVVRDDGVGIDPDFLPHVFDRFRQADNGSTRSRGGLGLGLSIVRHLVEAHGGTIRSESAGKDRGATFTVTLPNRVVDPRRSGQATDAAGVAPSGDGEEPAERTPTLAGIRVLIVDDEPDAREMTAAVLADAGAAVATAASSADALDRLGAFPADVLLIDIAMPGGDGYALLQQIRQSRGPASGVPAIALTAYAGSEDRVRALASGFRLHLAKPVQPSVLVNAVAELRLKTI